MSENPADLKAITPNEFLIQGVTFIPEKDLFEKKKNWFLKVCGRVSQSIIYIYSKKGLSVWKFQRI